MTHKPIATAVLHSNRSNIETVRELWRLADEQADELAADLLEGIYKGDSAAREFQLELLARVQATTDLVPLVDYVGFSEFMDLGVDLWEVRQSAVRAERTYANHVRRAHAMAYALGRDISSIEVGLLRELVEG